MTRSEVSPAAPLPTFLIIGAQKSATRWLRFNLGQHPDVFVAVKAEVSFFNDDRRFGLGSDFYRSQFVGWSGEPFIGESTPGYLMWRHEPAVVAARIESMVPAVRLFAVLRNPIDRAQSALRHHVDAQRLPPSTELLAYARSCEPATDRLGVISGGWYAASLEPFRERFADHLLVVLHDDIAPDPVGVYDQVISHLGASPGFVPPDVALVRNSNRRPSAAGRTDPPRPVDEELRLEDRVALYEFFRDDIARLEVVVGRDLSRWDPTSA